MNVNWNSDNRKWNVNDWNLDENGNWNADNHVVCPGHAQSFSRLFRREFCFEAFLPAPEHPPDFVELGGELQIFFIIDQLVLPADLKKEFEEVELPGCGYQICELLFGFGILRPKEYLERLEKKRIYFSSERVAMKLRNMRNNTLPKTIGSFEPLQDGQEPRGGGVRGKHTGKKEKIKLASTYDDIISSENLLEAWNEFTRGKRNRKDVEEFESRLADNIFSLHWKLVGKTYRHSRYEAFNISDPKPRNIHKASVKDRVAHRAIYRILYPFFERVFIADSYSCRNHKGIHKALNRFRNFAYRVSRNHSQTAWVLKCDIKKFFASIDHAVLLGILREHIPDENILNLLSEIIRSFHTEPGKGLPLGNLTSQLLVNVYMNEFDQFMKHQVKAKYYIRYADDFVIFSSDKTSLQTVLLQASAFLELRLFLRLHPDKVFIKTVASGVDFLGWTHFPDHRVLRTATKKRAFRNICEKEGKRETVDSYLGLLQHGNGYRIRKRIEATLVD